MNDLDASRLFNMKLWYDIETAPLPMAQLEKLMPEFEPAGNLKDPDKIKASIEAKKAEWLDKAALKAVSGKIVAVTIAVESLEPQMVDGDDEAILINVVLAFLKEVIIQQDRAYAWNGHAFDLPFICQRAAVHGIPAFQELMVNVRGRFYWHEFLIDPKLVWANYSQDHTGTSLKSVALALGVGEKVGSGKDFAELLKSDPAEAERYALADVNLLRSIVERMGI